MKFRPSKNLQIIEGKLIYTKHEYSFDFLPNVSADYAILIGYINLTFNSETKLARQIWGYEPYTVWEHRKLTPPNAIKTGLIIEEDIESGDIMRIFEAGELKSYFDPSNGWVCIGELSTFEDKEVVEFARNTIVVLKDGEIISLWLRPAFE